MGKTRRRQTYGKGGVGVDAKPDANKAAAHGFGAGTVGEGSHIAQGVEIHQEVPSRHRGIETTAANPRGIGRACAEQGRGSASGNSPQGRAATPGDKYPLAGGGLDFQFDIIATQGHLLGGTGCVDEGIPGSHGIEGGGGQQPGHDHHAQNPHEHHGHHQFDHGETACSAARRAPVESVMAFHHQ